MECPVRAVILQPHSVFTIVQTRKLRGKKKCLLEVPKAIQQENRSKY